MSDVESLDDVPNLGTREPGVDTTPDSACLAWSGHIWKGIACHLV